MSKAVLVIDMPESCDVCPIENDTFWICPVIRKSTGNKNGEPRYSGRHAECPLRPLPGKKDIKKSKTMTDFGWIEGWNACLQAIGGDK